MERYSLDKFPKTILRPEVVAKHEEHLAQLIEDIEEYSSLGDRDQSEIDWLLRVYENLGLSTVNDKYLGSLAIAKTRLGMFAILIDDTVDDVNKRDFKLLEELVKIPFSSDSINMTKFTEDEIRYLKFTQKIWMKLQNEIATYPHYEKYKVAFNFDLLQHLSAMRYSRLVNEFPNAANLVENYAYVPHSMTIMLHMDLDLMCSEGFVDGELGNLRELVYESQKMGKTGNLLATGHKELEEADMSSEIVVRIVREYGIDFKSKVSKTDKEKFFLKFKEDLTQRWEKEYQNTKQLSDKVKSIDGERFMHERELIQEAYLMNSVNWN